MVLPYPAGVVAGATVVVLVVGGVHVQVDPGEGHGVAAGRFTRGGGGDRGHDPRGRLTLYHRHLTLRGRALLGLVTGKLYS